MKHANEIKPNCRFWMQQEVNFMFVAQNHKWQICLKEQQRTSSKMHRHAVEVRCVQRRQQKIKLVKSQYQRWMTFAICRPINQQDSAFSPGCLSFPLSRKSLVVSHVCHLMKCAHMAACNPPGTMLSTHAASKRRGELGQGRRRWSMAPPFLSQGDKASPPHLHIRLMRW